MDVFDHPWLSGLFADPELELVWSAEAELTHMLAFEAAWSRCGHLAGLWSEADGAEAARAIEKFQINPAELSEGTRRDGVGVPELIKRLRASAGDAVHTGSTSQDVTDSARALMLVQTADILVPRLGQLDAALGGITDRSGANKLMGRTRMQAALPITVAHRVETWRAPLCAHQMRVRDQLPRIGQIQIGGPVGDRAALGENAQEFVDAVAAELGLRAATHSSHTARDGVVEFASTLSLITGSLGKMGQDLALMAQQCIDDVRLSGGGGSSAMPHKQNPILAELLVTLARYNAVLVGGMHGTLVHEQERSGAAWALEWMLLPQMAKATGRSLNAALELVNSIEEIGGASA